mmetsp:Transcript_30054/g.68248  ORF Transcript_30054/g.68248 Transcript_30054/m.68248 type:complete len:247 (+) Transcript_30054:396-1136(+)
MHVVDPRGVLLEHRHRVHAGVGEVAGVQAQGDEVLRQVGHGLLELVLVLDPAACVRVQGALDVVALHHLGDLLDGVNHLGPAVGREPGSVLGTTGSGLLLGRRVGHDHEELGAKLLQSLAGGVHLLEDHGQLVRLVQLLEDVARNELEVQRLQLLPELLGVEVAHRPQLRASEAGIGHELDNLLPRGVVGAVSVVDAPGAGVTGEPQLELFNLLPLGGGLHDLRHGVGNGQAGSGGGPGLEKSKTP